MSQEHDANPPFEVDRTLPEVVQKFLVGGGKLESIRLHADGKWTHEGCDFENDRIVKLFSRSVNRTEGGTWVLEIGRATPIVARRDRPELLDHQTRTIGQESELPGREAARPEVRPTNGACQIPDLGALVVDAQVGVEVIVLTGKAHLEVGGECAECQASTRAHGGGDAAQDRPIGIRGCGARTRSAGEAEGSLTERDGGIELGLVGHFPGIRTDECGAGGRGGDREVDEHLRDVDPQHLESPAGQLVGVPPGTAPDVEDPGTVVEIERLDEEVDLLHRAVGERVAEVSLTQVLGHLLEPVAGTRRRVSVAISTHALASAQVSPVATSTASSTRRS